MNVLCTNRPLSIASLVCPCGETVRFRIHNDSRFFTKWSSARPGRSRHAEPMKKFPETEQSDPNLAHVKPINDGEIVWQLTKAGSSSSHACNPAISKQAWSVRSRFADRGNPTRQELWDGGASREDQGDQKALVDASGREAEQRARRTRSGKSAPLSFEGLV